VGPELTLVAPPTAYCPAGQDWVSDFDRVASSGVESPGEGTDWA
jgi:hypothetical protein